jgi:hypothetical protein
MNPLPPWANGPFELLVHAEGHLINGGDFDRRIALISFDNAIEVAIMTYLTLNPIQRGNRSYPKEDVAIWLTNYHAKLDFLDHELGTRGLSWEVDRGHIVWAHDHRNEQYHGGNKGTPEKHVLALIRKAALWIFGVLFDVADSEQRLARGIAASAPPSPPQRDKSFDRVIDREFGMVDVADQTFYASELLFSVDNTAYRELGARLCDTQHNGDPKEKQNEQS